MCASLEGPDLLMVLAIVLLLFGAAKCLSRRGRSGWAKHEFEAGVREGLAEEEKPLTD
jgi:hypothetical protein